MLESTAITHSTGAIWLNRAPMMTRTMRSGRSMNPTLQCPIRDSARASVAHHDGGNHNHAHQDDVEEAVGASVVNQQAEEQGHVAVAIDDRIKKSAKYCYLVSGAGDTAIHHVENAGADDHQAGREEHALLVGAVGVAEQHCGQDVDNQPNKGKNVGRDTGQRQAAHNGVQHYTARPSKCICPAHLFVVDGCELKYLQLTIASWCYHG